MIICIQRRSFMVKYNFFIVFICLIFLSGLVSSYQLKMTVDECIFSFNEEPDGEGNIPFDDWDEENHRGVFMKIKNNNPNLGENENPSYSYTFYQNNGESRNYYNNFVYYEDRYSSFPILNIDENNNNRVYINCTFIVGNYRIYFLNYRHMYAYLRLTPDFNITKGIFDETNTPSLATFHGNTYSHSTNVFARNDVVYYFDNGNIEGTTLSQLLIDGFYPNTRPVVITSYNLAGVSPGIIRGYSLIREGGYLQLFDPFTTFFYVNSSHLYSPLVFPIIQASDTKAVIFDENNNEIVDFTAHCHSPSPSLCPFLGKDYTVFVNYSFRNPYDVELDDFTLIKRIGPIYMWAGGMNHVGDVNKMPTYTEYEYGISFEPFETKYFSLSYTFDDSYALPDSYYNANFYKSGGHSNNFWYRLGSDCVDYLGFNRYNTYIQLTRIDGKFIPVFRFDAELFVVNNRANSSYCVSKLEPGKYNLSFYLIDSGGNILDIIDFALDEELFEEKFGLDCSFGCSLSPGNYDYSFFIPITDEYIDMAGEYGEFFSMIYSVRNEEPFEGLRIARTGGRPKFDPGNLIYSVDNILEFYRNKKKDIAKLWIFNPTFYHTTLELDLIGLEDDFSAEYSSEISLYPLESRVVLIDVYANHDPWPVTYTTSSFELEARAILRTADGLEIREEKTPFFIFMFPETTSYFDIIVDYIEPTYLIFNNPARLKPQDVTLSWKILGSEDMLAKYHENNYFVNYSLVDNEGFVVKSNTLEYTFDKEKGSENLSFFYEFNYSFDYEVVLFVDSTFVFDDINFENNWAVFSYPTTFDLCYYNSSDNHQYNYDFFGDLSLDYDCIFSCCPRGYKCSEGYCAFAMSPDCANYDGNEPECNSFDINNPILCAYRQTDDKCLGCGFFVSSCGSYDNQNSCEKDNCGFAKDDAFRLGIEGNCVWTGVSCNFDDICNYNIEVIDGCAEKNSYVLRYTSENPDCSPFEMTLPCPHEVRINFFGLFQFFIVILLVFCFYFLKSLKLQSLFNKLL